MMETFSKRVNLSSSETGNFKLLPLPAIEAIYDGLNERIHWIHNAGGVLYALMELTLRDISDNRERALGFIVKAREGCVRMRSLVERDLRNWLEEQYSDAEDGGKILDAFCEGFRRVAREACEIELLLANAGSGSREPAEVIAQINSCCSSILLVLEITTAVKGWNKAFGSVAYRHWENRVSIRSLRELCGMYVNNDHERNISFTVSPLWAAPDEEGRIDEYPSELRELVHHIIGNAYLYAKTKVHVRFFRLTRGSLTIRCENDTDEWSSVEWNSLGKPGFIRPTGSERHSRMGLGIAYSLLLARKICDNLEFRLKDGLFVCAMTIKSQRCHISS